MVSTQVSISPDLGTVLGRDEQTDRQNCRS